MKFAIQVRCLWSWATGVVIGIQAAIRRDPGVIQIRRRGVPSELV